MSSDGTTTATVVTRLADELPSVRSQGASVFTYPLTPQLVRPLPLIGAFKFGITGPPGVYSVLGSTNLATWSAVGVATNPLGSVIFHDVTTNVLPQKFYRALLQVPPANMVFIPPNTFTMGSPDSEVGHQADEGPQTMVTLSRGFWIGKYEVTQGEYLAVTGENNSGFPGDLNRPVETVSFFAASNYCFLLTAQDQASGRIPPGSHYRLPTEAEWECAARAGTSTRFSYGDDPDLTGLSNFAWFGAHNGIVTHPVGQKLPNAWGLYDMAGNVWEWCADWYRADTHGAAKKLGIVKNPGGPAKSYDPTEPYAAKRVLKGGSFLCNASYCASYRPSARRGSSPDTGSSHTGFRCVKDIGGGNRNVVIRQREGINLVQSRGVIDR
jgi:formylglycine-generating enzyme required for sulfatase activity